jgi:hypothetical protein
MAKTKKTKKSKLKNKFHKLEMFLVLGIAVAIVGLLMVFSSMTNNNVTGKAFSYTGCTELPCLFNNVPIDHYQGFSYKGVLYKFKIKDLDKTNKRMKYEITTMEIDETEGKPDLAISHVDEELDDPYLNLDITIENIGDKNVYEAFKVTLKTLDEDDDVWKSTYKYVEGLDQDDEYILEMSIKYDNNYYDDSGKVPYEIYIDPADNIDESDETNNDEDDYYS